MGDFVYKEKSFVYRFLRDRFVVAFLAVDFLLVVRLLVVFRRVVRFTVAFRRVVRFAVAFFAAFLFLAAICFFELIICNRVVITFDQTFHLIMEKSLKKLLYSLMYIIKYNKSENNVVFRKMWITVNFLLT